MKAKINEKIICIPPYISTSWDKVSFMQTEQMADGAATLVLHLDDGKCIKIIDLDRALIDLAFSAHLKHLESKNGKGALPKEGPLGFLQNILGGGALPEQFEGMPFRFGVIGMPGGMESVFQHNAAQKEAPDLPKEVLGKIGQITKMMIAGDMNSLPKPEPHCNCPHCQLARAALGMEKEEEPVREEELSFRNWDILQKSEKLYLVTNPLDMGEQYNVFLGEPIGCTCGEKHCEHIKAVLLN